MKVTLHLFDEAFLGEGSGLRGRHSRDDTTT